MTEIKKPGTFDEGTPSFINNSSVKDNTKEPRVKAGTKEHVILSALVDGRSLTRFDANWEFYWWVVVLVSTWPTAFSIKQSLTSI